MFEAILAFAILIIFVLSGLLFGRTTAPIKQMTLPPQPLALPPQSKKKVRFNKRKKVIKYDKSTGEVVGLETQVVS